TFEVRGRKIDISSTYFPVDADLRISVSYLGSVHFIFLDVDLLRWLKSVLQVALDNGWKLGKGLLKRSQHRVLQVGSFKLRDEWFLRILEVSGVGKRFFVSIPMDEQKVGWGSFLKSVHSILEEMEVKQVPQNRGSFAEVVCRGTTNMEDSGGVVKHGSAVEKSIPCLKIGKEDGFERRAVALQRWVVVYFSLGPNDFIAWEGFRKWMDRWWGIGVGEEMKLLGDDSWLVEYESEEAASRIVERGLWFFRGVAVETRFWFPDAGRLNRLETRGLKWILVFEIPVHLRSEEVLRMIGELSGGFVDSQNTDFSAVRLKVRRKGILPSSLILEANKEKFEIKILEEPSFMVPVDLGKRSHISRLTALLAPAFRCLEEGQSSKVVAARFRGEEGGVVGGVLVQPMKSGRGPLDIHVFNGGPKKKDLVGLGPVNSLEEELIKDVGAKPLGCRAESTDWASFKVGPDLFYPLLSHFRPSSSLIGEDFILGLGNGKVDLEGQKPSFSSSFHSEGSELESLEEVESVSISDEESGSDFGFGVKDLVLGIAAGEGVKGNLGVADSEWDTISAMGQSLANLFELTVEGSKESALKEVDLVAAEVLQRKGISVSKSKKDNELRRIKWNLKEASLGDSARSSRYVPPDLVSNES
ncbi:hypothetical protein LINPERPRIM_LOCUS604, partial [Linum perenne]